MKLIGKCDEFTNGRSCSAKKKQGTNKYKPCIFSEYTEWKKEIKDKSKEEAIKFLQDNIMDLGLRMGECRKRITKKWCNSITRKEKIEEVRKQVQKEINRINSKIKFLLKVKESKRKQVSFNSD